MKAASNAAFSTAVIGSASPLPQATIVDVLGLEQPILLTKSASVCLLEYVSVAAERVKHSHVKVTIPVLLRKLRCELRTLAHYAYTPQTRRC